MGEVDAGRRLADAALEVLAGDDDRLVLRPGRGAGACRSGLGRPGPARACSRRGGCSRGCAAGASTTSSASARARVVRSRPTISAASEGLNRRCSDFALNGAPAPSRACAARKFSLYARMSSSLSMAAGRWHTGLPGMLHHTDFWSKFIRNPCSPTPKQKALISRREHRSSAVRTRTRMPGCSDTAPQDTPARACWPSWSPTVSRPAELEPHFPGFPPTSPSRKPDAGAARGHAAHSDTGDPRASRQSRASGGRCGRVDDCEPNGRRHGGGGDLLPLRAAHPVLVPARRSRRAHELHAQERLARAHARHDAAGDRIAVRRPGTAPDDLLRQ